MGMFDDIRVKVALPVPLDADHRDHWFQTKCLDCEMNHYEIREDGTLWVERYDTEPAPPGSLSWPSRVNHRWEQLATWSGAITFYTQPREILKSKGVLDGGWLEVLAIFIKGELKHLELLQYQPPTCKRIARHADRIHRAALADRCARRFVGLDFDTDH